MLFKFQISRVSCEHSESVASLHIMVTNLVREPPELTIVFLEFPRFLWISIWVIWSRVTVLCDIEWSGWKAQIFLALQLICDWVHLSCTRAKGEDVSQNEPWLEKSAPMYSSYRLTGNVLSHQRQHCNVAFLIILLIILDK